MFVFLPSHAKCFFTVANEVSMTIEGSGETKCGENVNLLCSLEDKNMTVVEFSWILILTANSTKVLCNYSNIVKKRSNGIHCKYEPNQHLALTIERVQQSHNGTYVCKVQTNTGHNSREISQKVTGGFYRNQICNSNYRTHQHELRMETAVLTSHAFR